MSDQRDYVNHIGVTYHGEIHPKDYGALVYALHCLNRDRGVTFNLRCKPRDKGVEEVADDE